MDDQIINELRQSYDHMAEERDKQDVAPWKKAERQYFLSLLSAEEKQRLLDIGAGTGIHGQFFQEQGLEVICIDLSPVMVHLCQQKGLMAYVMDVMHLAFPEGSFDAVYALNCLLHVPRSDFPSALKAIRRVLRADGLLYVGQYGGVEREGVWAEDPYRPKRFFSFLTDEQIQDVAARFFERVSFHRIPLPWELDSHFQSMVWRRI